MEKKKTFMGDFGDFEIEFQLSFLIFFWRIFHFWVLGFGGLRPSLQIFLSPKQMVVWSLRFFWGIAIEMGGVWETQKFHIGKIPDEKKHNFFIFYYYYFPLRQW